MFCIVKALALGADACMAGRAYLYALGAAGEPGVDHVIELLRSGSPMIAPAEAENNGLTAREVELLEVFAKGGSYKEAARILGISPFTVGNHVKSVYRKLAVHSRGEAVYEAVKTGQLRL